jgi:iron complex outermembrane receptor protein
MSYLHFGRGFKSGGVNARATKEIEFEPFDAETVDNLEVGLTIANYDEFDALDSSGEIVDKSDLDFPRTPRWNVSARLQYTLPFNLLPVDGTTSFLADYSWQSKTYNDVDNSDIAQGSFGILNLRLSMQLLKPDLELAFFVKNVADKDYVTGGLDFSDQFGYTGVFLGPPRTYAAQLTWRYRGG